MNEKQLGQWLKALPASTDIFGRYDWTTKQWGAVRDKVQADRQAWTTLYSKLESADETLAGVANDCALENIDPTLNESQFGYWSELRRQLSSAAGMIWESHGRNVNEETGLKIY